jgi:hypothetical protein
MENLYPARQRCKTCRKKFEDGIVLVGLYCSYKCGNFPQPAKNITDAPRSCKREVSGSWGYKTRYTYEMQVPEKYRLDPSTNIYACDNCRMYHIGHNRIEEKPLTQEKLSRYVKSIEELGSVIQRYRESRGIDKKVLAKSLKIPAIRITEIEAGSPKASMKDTMAVLNALRLRIDINSSF